MRRRSFYRLLGAGCMSTMIPFQNSFAHEPKMDQIYESKYQVHLDWAKEQLLSNQPAEGNYDQMITTYMKPYNQINCETSSEGIIISYQNRYATNIEIRIFEGSRQLRFINS